MIVRIQGEGKFRLPDETLDEINVLDAALEAALDQTDEAVFAAALAALLDRVRSAGHALDPEEIAESDVILPAADATEEEVRSMLTEEGLLPADRGRRPVARLGRSTEARGSRPGENGAWPGRGTRPTAG